MILSHSRSPKCIWVSMFALVVIGMLFQACSTTVNIEKGAVSLTCGSDGMKDRDVDPSGACDSVSSPGQDATGYYSKNGTNPVPSHTPPYTCSSRCTNPGANGCNLRYLSRKCTNEFTYPATGTVGTCTCPCL